MALVHKHHVDGLTPEDLDDLVRAMAAFRGTQYSAGRSRACKPQPEAYLSAARLLDLEPGQCMMVASHYHDLMAARACGLRTVYVVRKRQFGERNEYRGELEVGVVVEDFEELAARIA